MALTSAQRTTVRNAFVGLANTANDGWTSGKTASAWADEQMALLDAYRAQTRPRAHYTLRHRPWIAGRLTGLSAAVRTAIDNHVAGS